ncbi:hypothetical protein BJ508DRAFT_372770 [Ascobolus immersus RN42]|uniref:Uncharacterized protein n=1 Tax=Ascobolus immersus RN42 TaxID=1160509 RepID=A0A3N4IK46_ASCIM|nr:hypothetical protein BJ508DRAFT_372770 [Ascobolus immersus RN42]
MTKPLIFFAFLTFVSLLPSQATTLIPDRYPSATSRNGSVGFQIANDPAKPITVASTSLLKPAERRSNDHEISAMNHPAVLAPRFLAALFRGLQALGKVIHKAVRGSKQKKKDKKEKEEKEERERIEREKKEEKARKDKEEEDKRKAEEARKKKEKEEKERKEREEKKREEERKQREKERKEKEERIRKEKDKVNQEADRKAYEEEMEERLLAAGSPPLGRLDATWKLVVVFTLMVKRGDGPSHLVCFRAAYLSTIALVPILSHYNLLDRSKETDYTQYYNMPSFFNILFTAMAVISSVLLSCTASNALQQSSRGAENSLVPSASADGGRRLTITASSLPSLQPRRDWVPDIVTDKGKSVLKKDKDKDDSSTKSTEASKPTASTSSDPPKSSTSSSSTDKSTTTSGKTSSTSDGSGNNGDRLSNIPTGSSSSSPKDGGGSGLLAPMGAVQKESKDSKTGQSSSADARTTLNFPFLAGVLLTCGIAILL